MTDAERDTWNQKYRSGDVHLPEGPTPALRERVAWFPDGRALDVATGLGRNARFLADHGYRVDAIDVSREGLELARERTDPDAQIEWIEADVDEYAFPERAYAVAVVSYYRNTDRLSDVLSALVPGGVLVYEHPVSSPDERDPSSHAFAPNELLHATLDAGDCTVLYYEEDWAAGVNRPKAVLVARRDT